jgi:hypothetical protein
MNFTHIVFIIIFVIICAYLFGVIMISVFKSKLDIFLENKEFFENNEKKSQLKQIFEQENIIKSSNQDNNDNNDNNNDNDNNNKENFSNQESEELIVIKKKYLIEKLNNPNKKDNNEVQQKIAELYGNLNNESLKTNVNGYSQIELNDSNGYSVWNFDYEKHDEIKNICFLDHEHTKNCSYGNTNFADPRRMSEIEKRTFTLNYPPNMTMQDYVNWLYCFVGKEDQLPYNHLKNLEKLKKKIPLVKEEGVCPPPPQYFPPLDSEKYFKNMYDAKSKELAFAPKLNSTTSSLLGANYNQYSEFNQNFGQYGTSGQIVNPDIVYKKKARDVDNIIIPKNGNDLDLQKKYKPYFVKQIEV